MNMIGSFKDPLGQVSVFEQHIQRSCNLKSKNQIDCFLKSNLYLKLTNAELIHPARWSENQEVIIQDKIAPWIYPYEWSFEMLKSAALHTLKIQKIALENSYTLKDASAFNITFVNLKPLHIDFYSFVEFVPQLAWSGLDQFYREFVNPLLIQSELGIYFQDYFKAKLNGIPTAELNSLFSFPKKIKPQIFSLVTCKAFLDRRFTTSENLNKHKVPSELLLKLQIANIDKLIKKISKINKKGASSWSNYKNIRNYLEQDFNNKVTTVESFLAKTKPLSLVDYGCNNGEFSLLARKYSAQILAIDLDADCIDDLYKKTDITLSPANLNIAVIDLSNPSPALGWNNLERSSFLNRSKGYQAFFALALVHHLRITANIPTKMILEFFAERHEFGLIEYVSPEDQMLHKMLIRQADFDLSDYKKPIFIESCLEFFEICSEISISKTRSIFHLKSKIYGKEK